MLLLSEDKTLYQGLGSKKHDKQNGQINRPYEHRNIETPAQGIPQLIYSYLPPPQQSAQPQMMPQMQVAQPKMMPQMQAPEAPSPQIVPQGGVVVTADNLFRQNNIQQYRVGGYS